MNITSPHLQHSHGENSPQLSGLPASAERATRLGEVPHFTCERDQEIKRDCMERLVTPPRRGTSPTWGPPPPCEQALIPLKIADSGQRWNIPCKHSWNMADAGNKMQTRAFFLRKILENSAKS